MPVVRSTKNAALSFIADWLTHEAFNFHFGLSFAYDAPKNLNDLLDDVRSATSLHSFRKFREMLKTYLFAQAYSP